MSLSLDGSVKGEKSHFLCAFWKKPLPSLSSTSLVEPRSESELSPEDRETYRLGRILSRQVVIAWPKIGGDAEVEAMTRLAFVGYMHEVGRIATKPTSHVGEEKLYSSFCDFCGANEVAGFVKPQPFWNFVTPNPGELPILYRGPWNHCSGCASAVAAKDHQSLAKRAMGSRPAHEKDPERRRRHFEGLYEQVLKEASE